MMRSDRADDAQTMAGLNRRGMIRNGLIWGSAGALAVEGVGAASAAANSGKGKGKGKGGGKKLTLDVACLGDTFSLTPAIGTDPATGQLYASPFLVRGAIFKGGSIPAGEGFDPAGHDSIGVWFCHGFLLFGSDVPLPDVTTTQEHVLGEIGPSAFGQHSLHSNGFEPHDDTAAAVRPVIGGTGRYAGAQGVVTESAIGTNITKLPDGTNAPNLRFAFRVHR